MPRKSTSKSTSASTRGHKRQLSTESPAVVTPGTRASKRIKESNENTPTSVTTKKSKYFEGPDSDEDEDDDEESDSDADPNLESGYEDEDGSEAESLDDAEEDEDDYNSEEEKVKKKQGRQSGSAKKSGGIGAAILDTGKQLWREGVKAGLGPGKAVFIEKPKPRGDGGVKYVPERIHANTMLFLGDLKKNNERQWLKMHDPDYRQSWKDWESFVETLSEKISEVDETVPELPPKDLVFRIYRDVRFSPDPTPYKAHFSAAFSRTGRKGPFACYYVQISPGGQSFVGGGLWMPEAQQLALLRRDIDRHPERFKLVLTHPDVRKHLLGGIPNEEKKAIKAFASSNQENALKTKPKGFDADHPNIELLRLRNFTIGKRLTEKEVLSNEVISRIMEIIGAMVPFVTYLNSVVMPDEDASDSDEPSNENSDDNDDDADADADDADLSD